MVKICGVISLVVFVLSASVHIATFFPSISGSTLENFRSLHLAAMVVFATALIHYMKQAKLHSKKHRKGHFIEWKSAAEQQRSFQSKAFSATALPLRVLCVVAFFYAGFNFVSNIKLMEWGVPHSEHGQYYLQSHGSKIRDLTKEEYERFLAYDVRGFSGHWIIFSLVPTVYLLVAHPRLEKSTTKRQVTKTGNILEDLLTSPPNQRYQNLRNPEFLKALDELEVGARITWLEQYIVSPVVSDWTWLLNMQKPQWHHLDRWMRLDKTHALTAVDVLLGCSDFENPYNETISPKLPTGANPQLINASLDFVLANYGNPRLRDAAKKIRHVWPVGLQKRQTVKVPEKLKRVADILFRYNSGLYDEWHESMVTEMEPTTNPFGIWDSLLHFAARKELVAIVDWNERPEEIIAWLKSLPTAKELDIRWEQFEEFEGDNEALLSSIGSAISGQGQVLVSLDHGSDDIVIAFLLSETFSEFETAISSFGDSSMKVLAYR